MVACKLRALPTIVQRVDASRRKSPRTRVLRRAPDWLERAPLHVGISSVRVGHERFANDGALAELREWRRLSQPGRLHRVLRPRRRQAAARSTRRASRGCPPWSYRTMCRVPLVVYVLLYAVLCLVVSSDALSD